MVLFLILPPFRAAAQTTYYTTFNIPYPLEALGHSARAAAMASAFTAAEGDLNCLFWNPSGLDGMASPEISLLHQDWISGLSQETLAAALPIGKAGTLGFGLNALNYGSLEGYDSGGDPTGSIHPFRSTFLFGWGGTLLHSLSMGFSSRSIFQSVAPGDSSFSTALTAGALWRALPSLRVGAYYTFLNAGYPPQQGILKIGETWGFSLFPQGPTLLQVDFSLPPQGVYLIQGGVEQPFFRILFFRLGYQMELRDNQISGFRGFTGGIGVEWEGLSLDYAYSPQGELGFSQMVGLTYRFPGPQPTPLPQPRASLPSASPLSFKPPASINPEDKVVRVEVHFDLPNGPAATSQPSDPALEMAIEEAGQQVQLHPKDAVAWVNLGNLYWRSGRPEFTVQCFGEALKIDPSNRDLGAWLDRYRSLNQNPVK